MKSKDFFDELENSIGDFIFLETSIGGVRQGKLTGFTHRTIIYNDLKVDVVIEIEVNGDPSDRIPLSEIVKMEID